jgi:hypothetical protein
MGDRACTAFSKLRLSDQAINAMTHTDLVQVVGHNTTYEEICEK